MYLSTQHPAWGCARKFLRTGADGPILRAAAMVFTTMAVAKIVSE
jgi:hypothetical protein